MKRFLSSLLVLAMACAMAPAALAAGNSPQEDFYAPGTFSDVPEGVWYEEDLSVCYNMGLVSGIGAGRFSPSSSVTLAEAVTFVARIHNAGEDNGADFTQGTPWYQVYVDYAEENGIVNPGQYADYNVPATRRQFADMVARCLPARVLTVRNPVEDGAIPDLKAGSPSYERIYSLYRAGIFTGSEGGNFNPETAITRAEVTAVLSRCVDETRVRLFMLTKEGYVDHYLGGIAFDLPPAYVSLGSVGGFGGMSLYAAMEGDLAAASLMTACLFLGVTDRSLAENKDAFVQMVKTSLEEGQGATFTASESTLLGYPRVVFEGVMTDFEPDVQVKLRADLVFNTDNGHAVLFVIGVDSRASGDYMAEYLRMLENAKVDKTGLVKPQIRPDFQALVDSLLSFTERFVYFAQRYNAATEAGRQTMTAELEALKREYLQLEEKLDAFTSAEDLSNDELMYLLTRMSELSARLPANYQEELDKLGENLGILVPDLGMPDYAGSLPAA